MLSQCSQMRSPLYKFLSNIAALIGRDSIQLLEVKMQGKLATTFFAPFRQTQEIPVHVVLLLSLEILNLALLQF